MVGKRHSTSGGSAKKSPVAAEPALASRPKRNISPKCLDVTTGLSWREERELKKALYASLHDARKSAKSETSGSDSVTDGTPPKSDSSEPSTPNVKIQTLDSDEPGNSQINQLYNGQSGPSRGQRSSSLPNIPVTKLAKLRHLRNTNQHSEPNYPEGQCSDTPPTSSTNSRSNSLDESSQDSTSRSSFSTNAPTPQSLGASTSTLPETKNRAKVHAQRKFASLQNCGTAGYTCYSPSSATPPVSKIPAKTSPVQMFPKRAKTEDFLTFLCLRGTPALPPHLDFFNFTRYDGTNYMSPHKSGRESSPSSTSTSLSNFNHDETGENSRTFSPVSKHITPTKKAARASAGTPETARGLQGVRPRLTKNSLKAQSPLAKSTGKIKHQSLRKRSPPKMTRSFSVPRTVQKIGMMRRSSETNPIRLSAPSKLAIKRKSDVSLNAAKLTGSKVKKSSINEADEGSQRDRTNLDNTQENKFQVRHSLMSPLKFSRHTINSKEIYERKVTSVGMELRVRINLRKPKRKPTSDFIAMRLPKRQAKENALKFYMESDDLDNDENRSTSDEEITFPKKRKLDSGYDIDNCKIPFKKSRLKKTENRAKKSITHGKKLIRCSKELKKLTEGNPEQLAANINDDSEGVSTRSASKNLSQKFGSRGSAAKVFANKKLQKIKEMKRKDLTRKPDAAPTEGKDKEKVHVADSIAQKVTSGKDDVGSKEYSKTGKKESPQQTKRSKGRPLGSQNKPKEGKEKKQSLLKQRNEPRHFHREVSTSMTEVPTFFPTEEEFQQPIKYIQSISPMAEPFGMCKIIPPNSWKMDGKISEDVRFTTQKQYIHKMYKRFGPITEQLECIKRHLETQSPQEPVQVPTVGGVEIDLCKLSETIDKFGGMQHVIEKKKWMKVADAMNIPKLAQDRGTKLYDAYCKCLLSYNGLSMEEKEKLSTLVKADRQKIRCDEQEEDCVVKGKSMSLGAFNRVARNTLTIWTKDEQMSTDQIEREYWNTVSERASHVVVHGGHVDTKTQNCSMFPYKKENPYSKHPWNLNNLPNHKSSLLQYLHHVSGVTVPTLHVGMLYTTSCWSTDTHHLPYVQYLHNEADIIWYCIPSQEETKFQSVMRELVPTLVSSKIRWLKEDTAMVPPEVLLQRGVHVSRCVQQPHQFVVVFPKCYTATISCGYTLAESSHYATKEWLPLGVDVAKILNKSREEELFSMEELLCNIVEDVNSSPELLLPALMEFEKIVDRELSFRKVLYEIGLKSSKRMAIATPTPRSSPGSGRRNSTDLDESITRCEISKKICFLSLVLNEAEDLALSMEQALIHLQKKKNLKTCKLLFRHTEEELRKILGHARQRLKSIQPVEEQTSPKRGKNLQYESEFQRFIDNGSKAKRKPVIGQKNKIFISESNKI